MNGIMGQEACGGNKHCGSAD